MNTLALEGLAEEENETMPLAAAEQLGLYLDGLASGTAADPSVLGYDAASHKHGDARSVMSEASKFSHSTPDDRVPMPITGSIAASMAASSTVDAADLQGLNLDGHDFETAGIPGLEAGAHQLTWEEEREQAFAAGSSVDFNAPSELSIGSDSWAPVSAPQTGLQSIHERKTKSEALEAASLDLNLDGMDSSIRKHRASEHQA